MFTRAGIKFTINYIKNPNPETPMVVCFFQVDVNEQPRQKGYPNFSSCIYFDPQGNLVTVGAWE